MNKNLKVMYKKVGMVSGIILMVLIVTGIGSIYVVKIGLPYLRHESSLQGFYNYIMCTRCINADFTKEEIEERLLSEMKVYHLSIDEVENMILESRAEKVAILDNPGMSQKNVLLRIRNIGRKNTRMEEEKKINRQQNMIFFIREKSLPYHDKVLAVIQKFKQEQK
jgi:hypothetical protein